MFPCVHACPALDRPARSPACACLQVSDVSSDLSLRGSGESTEQWYPMEQKQHWIWISFALSAGIIVVLLLRTVDENTLPYLQSLHPSILLAALGLRLLALGIWGLRIVVLSRGVGTRVPYPLALNAVLLNLIPAAITPGKMGGEPVRIQHLTEGPLEAGDATAVVVMERVLDGFAFTCLTIIAFVFLGYALRGISPLFLNAFLFMLALLMGLAFTFIYLASHPPVMKRIADGVICRWQRLRARSTHIDPRQSAPPLIARANYEIDGLNQAVSLLAGRGRIWLGAGFACTLCYWVAEFSIASVLLVGLGLPPFFLRSFLFQLIIALVETLPLTPGSAGVAEVAAASIYSLIVPSSALGVFVILWRFYLFFLILPLGLAATLLTAKKRVW
jgi:uncharacterized protein (TIRG00374 family)